MSPLLESPSALFGAFLLATTLGFVLSLLGEALYGPRGFWIVCVCFALVVVHLVSSAIEALPNVSDGADEGH